MAGAIDKKINDVVDELESQPASHILARAEVLGSITLSREFAQTFLNALCETYTSASGSYSLHQICTNLAQQRNICFGAKEIATSSRSFDLPSPGTVNGALGLTEPGTSSMGIKATSIDETYTITLNTSSTETQTQGSNTFSVYIGDYYLVRSRVSGELIDISDNVSPYTTPDGGDVVFGNIVPWVTGTGGDVSGELEANTWSYHWATVNLASVVTTNSGNYNEITTLTLADTLTQGSNTDYTPLGPSFGNKFYLKRHADYVNTFTITGTTTMNSVSITGVSEADLAKVKHGDVISGTGIPDNNVTIQAVQTEKGAIRLSETGVVTVGGTITLTVNSVPFGYAKDDIFCQLEVVAEGLVKNDNWKPTGDGAGGYSGANEAADDTLVANTSQFIGMLGFFDPGNAGSDDLIKSSSSLYVSEGKEYNETSYPDIEKNPIFPATAGTTKAKEVKEGEIVGTQPTGLSDQDVWCGRFVSWNKDRKDGVPQNVGEYRYKIDNAEKYFYAPPSHVGYDYGTTGDVIADPNHPPTVLASPPSSESEPRNICPRAGMSSIVARATSTTSAHATNSATTTVPQDDAIKYHTALLGSGQGPTDPALGGVSGSGDRNGSIGSFYLLEANNMITTNHVHATIDVTVVASPPSTSYTISYENRLDGVFSCRYNHVQKHLYEALAANTDMAFIMDTVDQLQALDSFRDPITTGTAAPRAASGGTAGDANGTGISDADFETYLNSEPEGDKGLLDTGLTKYQAKFDASGRGAKTYSSGGEPARGSAVDFASFTQDSVAYNGVTLWGNFSTELNTFKDNCDKRVREIDARIGVPTYAGSAASRGSAPAIKVDSIPSSNTTNGVLPYGRSIFNNVNHLLGKDVDLLGGIIKDVESLTDLVGLVKTARNKYDIFSGRDKAY